MSGYCRSTRALTGPRFADGLLSVETQRVLAEDMAVRLGVDVVVPSPNIWIPRGGSIEDQTHAMKGIVRLSGMLANSDETAQGGLIVAETYDTDSTPLGIVVGGIDMALGEVRELRRQFAENANATLIQLGSPYRLL